jgi:hypothetical protein
VSRTLDQPVEQLALLSGGRACRDPLHHIGQLVGLGGGEPAQDVVGEQRPLELDLVICAMRT